MIIRTTLFLSVSSIAALAMGVPAQAETGGGLALAPAQICTGGYGGKTVNNFNKNITVNNNTKNITVNNKNITINKPVTLNKNININKSFDFSKNIVINKPITI